MKKVLDVRFMSFAFVLFAMCLSQNVYAEARGESAIDDVIGLEAANTRAIVDLSVQELDAYKSGNFVLDTLFRVSKLRVGLPYKWGGSDWRKGVDCSHFTLKIYQDVAQYYSRYMTTHTLKDVVAANGLRKVSVSSMQPGDLLVYGYYDRDGKWHGHVVILISDEYRTQGFRGLVVGSHGGIGLQFLSYKGFPQYYRTRNITLRNVLRVIR